MSASVPDRAATPAGPSPEEVSGIAGIPCAARLPEITPADTDRGSLEMMARDHARMRLAGGNLAEAAMRVIHDYDGLHRLSLAVAGWAEAVAAEGDRPSADIEGRVTALEQMVWPLGR